VKEIEEIPSDNASDQKPVQEGTGAVKIILATSPPEMMLI
jgi:hypothetical protein